MNTQIDADSFEPYCLPRGEVGRFAYALLPVLSLSFLIFLVTAEQVRSQDPGAANVLPSIDAIIAHWEKRTTQIQSARFVWTKRQEMPRASLVGAAAFFERDAKAPPISAEGIHVSETICTLSFEGEKMRFEMHGEVPSFESPTQLAPRNQVIVFDGNSTADYQPGAAKGERGQAIVAAEKNEILRDPAVTALLWNLRPNQLAKEVESWEVSWTKDLQDGRIFVALTEPTAKLNGSLRRTFWLDQSKDYAIVRCLKTNVKTDKLVQQVDILLAIDKSVGWIASGWTYVQPGAHKESLIVISKVSEYSINGRAEGDTPFQIALPQGTLVVDLDGNKLKPSVFSNLFWLILAIGFVALFGLLWVGRRRANAGLGWANLFKKKA